MPIFQYSKGSDAVSITCTDGFVTTSISFLRRYMPELIASIKEKDPEFVGPRYDDPMHSTIGDFEVTFDFNGNMNYSTYSNSTSAKVVLPVGVITAMGSNKDHAFIELIKKLADRHLYVMITSTPK
ncbi:MAG: hypothetical protein WC525_09700, partial [Candidatus Thermoplasmatota archaeon]